ncbi:MAG: hypothetical protein EXR75_11120 [Myxococcales bacterium]|nr:hypothetical protein [Myxococcales bacterium]
MNGAHCRNCHNPLELMFGVMPTQCPRCGTHDPSKASGASPSPGGMPPSGYGAPGMPPPDYAPPGFGLPGMAPRAHSGGGGVRGVIAVLIALGAIVPVGIVGFGKYAKRFTTVVDRGDRTPDANPGGNPGGKPAAKATPSWVGAAGPTRVDPVDVIVQAVAQAKQSDPHAKLVGANFNGLTQGALDLTKGAAQAFVRFEYRWLDASQPAGKDVNEGSFYFIMSPDGVLTEFGRHGGMAMELRPGSRDEGAFPLPTPRCTAQQAWKVAVESGVPNDAVATVHFDNTFTANPRKDTEWSFRVEGHDEYRREIDAQSCSLRRSWGANGSPTKVRPAGPPRGLANCRRGDPLCNAGF